MQSITITAIAAPHAIANVIEGFDGETLLVDPTSNASCQVRPGMPYTELRFTGDNVESARVTIERPDYHYGDTLHRATVGWSSSSSQPGAGDAALTLRVLDFAIRVADVLNGWADADALPRLLDDKAHA